LIEADRQEVERYYQTLSTWIRLHGAEHLGARYVVVRLARMEVTGPLDFSDIQRVLRRVVDFRSWYEAWHAEALEAEETAERFVAEGRLLSAGDMFHRAAMCHHWGQYLARVGSEQKREGRVGRVACYRRAVECLDARIEPLRIPFGGPHLPGYLHLPDDAGAGPPACVVMVNGADSVKEEYHNWARQFVRRGLAVLTMDGPGQGELVGVLPMRPDAWEQPVGAALDARAPSGRVAGGRVRAPGPGGRLLGRVLRLPGLPVVAGLHPAQRDGGPDAGLPLRGQGLCRGALHPGRLPGADRRPLPGHPRRPGRARDCGEGRRMAEGRLAEFVNFEDGYHTCTNYNATLVPLMCDWMAAKLGN
jgi:hypothetical protein